VLGSLVGKNITNKQLTDSRRQIVEANISKVGKHGTAKVHFIGLNVWSGSKIEEIHPADQKLEVPYQQRVDYQVPTPSTLESWPIP
jgi:translation elongation factor P/translation initiation factor 5A